MYNWKFSERRAGVPFGDSEGRTFNRDTPCHLCHSPDTASQASNTRFLRVSFGGNRWRFHGDMNEAIRTERETFGGSVWISMSSCKVKTHPRYLLPPKRHPRPGPPNETRRKQAFKTPISIVSFNAYLSFSSVSHDSRQYAVTVVGTVGSYSVTGRWFTWLRYSATLWHHRGWVVGILVSFCPTEMHKIFIQWPRQIRHLTVCRHGFKSRFNSFIFALDIMWLNFRFNCDHNQWPPFTANTVERVPKF